MLRRDKPAKSKDLTPKLKQLPQKQPKQKLAQHLSKIQNQLSQFLVDNFSSVLDNAFDSMKYYGKIIKMLSEFQNGNCDVLGGIFKKIKAVIQPLSPPPNPIQKQRKKSLTNNVKHDGGLLLKLENELRSQNDLIARLSDQNIRLKVTLKSQLQHSQQDRMKQNRMTQLLYILRKKHVDIDRIYEENCETPGISKRNSFQGSEGESSEYLQQENQ